MNTLNKDIDEFLEYYCNLVSPEYAVLLKGKWGSGKTYYINKFISSLKKNKQKFVYVSLYGVSSYEEIEDKFFEQLHPSLSNKKMIIGGRTFKKLLKSTYNPNMDENHKNKISNNSFPSYLTDTQEHILIFDDLERCSIPINDMLGYMNYFVEHQSYRVIIVANEDELQKDDKEYPVIKEKLIGKIFELKSNVDLAFISFINNLDNEELFYEYSDTIKDIYLASDYNNLRFLRQTIFDFDRFYNIILHKHKKKAKLIEDMLRLYFIFSLENKKNDFHLCKVDEYYREYRKLSYSSTDKRKANKTKYKISANKYRFDFYYSKILDMSIWENILNRSIIDIDGINKALKSSIYYSDEFTPNWKKLWHFQKLSEDEFENILKTVEAELEDKTYDNIYVVIHVCSLLMYLSSARLYKLKKNDILSLAKSHISYLFKEEKIDVELFENSKFVLEQTGYDGLSFLAKDDEHFKVFQEYISMKLNKGKKQAFSKHAQEIVDLIGIDDKKLFIRLNNTRTKGSRYYDKPILSFVDVKLFADKILTISVDSQKNLGSILEQRYKHIAFNKDLVSEIEFLSKLKTVLINAKNKLDGKLGGYNLELFIDNYLSVALDDLESYISNNSSQKTKNSKS